MKKKFVMISASLVALSLASCASTEETKPEQATTQQEASQQEEQMLYEIMSEEKDADRNERILHVSTDVISERDFDMITKEIMGTYAKEGLDSMHVYMYEPRQGEKENGELMAHSYIAYTDKGASKMGLPNPNSYRLDLSEK